LDAKAATSHTHTDYAPTSHTHTITSVTNLQTSLDAKAATTHTHADYAPTSHAHTIANVTNLQTSLDAKAATTHTHTITCVTNLQTSLDAKAATTHTHADYAPTSHAHTIANVTNLQTSLDAKAATTHTHTIANVTNLQTSLDAKAATSHTHSIANVTDFKTNAWTTIDRPEWTNKLGWDNIGPFMDPPQTTNFDVIAQDSVSPSANGIYNLGQLFRRWLWTHTEIVKCNRIFFDAGPNVVFTGSYNELRDKPSTPTIADIPGLQSKLDELQTKLDATPVYDELLIYYSNVTSQLGVGGLYRTVTGPNVVGKVEGTLSIQLMEYVLPAVPGVTINGASLHYKCYFAHMFPWGPPKAEGIISVGLSVFTTQVPNPIGGGLVAQDWTLIKQAAEQVISPNHDSGIDVVRIVLYINVSTPLTPSHDILCFSDTLTKIAVGTKQHVTGTTFHR
jgi:hypothetical protein